MKHKIEKNKSWRCLHPKKSLITTRKWRNKNQEKSREINKKYRKTEKGKFAEAKIRAKRRNFGWILMFENPFDDSILVDYHHITDVYVVAIPKDLHYQYMGKYHRENTMEIVKQIYLNGVVV